MNVPEIHRELAHAWVDGAEVEQWCEHTQSWLSGSLLPSFSAPKYRLKPIPHSIDWSHVNERYIVLVAHKTGEVRLVTKAPTRGPGENWYSVPGPGESIDAENFTSFKRGTVSWDESLVFRPSKEMCAEPVKVDRIGLTAEQWAQIPSEYNWIAKDQDGYWYAHESEPESEYDPTIDYGAWEDNQNPNSPFPITTRLPGLLPNLQGSELWEDCLIERPHPPAAPLNVWQQAIDAELVSAHLGVAHNDATFEGAQKAIHELICWHIDVATNPATNGGQRLTDAKPIVLPEPDSYLFQHEDTGQTMFVDAQQVEWGFEANNPRLHKVSGVYTEQQVRELLAQALAATNEVTVLPDGSAFAVYSYPLPKDHWLYAPREYEHGAEEPKELAAPILTHTAREQVVSAIRYAVRAATDCGKETNFDPDTLVQNAVYALCGPFNKNQPQADARDAAFEAVRKKLCKLQRYSFWLDEHGGGVQRVKDRCGNWIGFDAAHELFDPVAIDAAMRQSNRGGI